MQNITPNELADFLQAGEITILDVREPEELQICSLENCLNIPVELIGTRMRELDPNSKIVCLCHSGRRSLRVANYLSAHGFENIFNLTGGIDAWARIIDPTMPRY